MPKKKKKPLLPQYVVVKLGAWYVRRTFSTAETYESGKPKRIEITRRCFPETEDRAKEISSQIEAELFASQAERERVKNVGEYIKAFLLVKKKSITRRTYEDYVHLLDRYIAKTPFAALPISEVKTKQVQTFINDLECSATMVRKIFVPVRMAFHQGVIWEDIVKNPTLDVILPKPRKEEASAFTKMEVKQLLPVFRGDPDYLAFELDLELGLRPQELLALSWPKLNLVSNKARIDKALSDGLEGGAFEIKGPKTKASIRTLSFSPYMRDRLLEHKKRQEMFLADVQKKIAEPLVVPPDYKKGTNYEKRKARRKHYRQILANFRQYDLVFPASNGLPQKCNNLNRREFKAAITKAGFRVTDYSVKSLRHTYASIMAEKLSMKRLQYLMGHASPVTTMKYYVHIDTDNQSEANDLFIQELYQEI